MQIGEIADLNPFTSSLRTSKLLGSKSDLREVPVHLRDDEFNDLLFIEANYSAGIIADESGMTHEKSSTAAVFKSVDKLFGCSHQDRHVPNEENLLNQLDEFEKMYTFHFQDGNIDRSQNSNFKDPIRIIKSLSKILGNYISNEKQKCKAQSLLFSLVKIILPNDYTKSCSHFKDACCPCTIGSDSEVPSPIYELLGLRQQKNVSQPTAGVIAPLDLSMKPKPMFEEIRCGSQKNLRQSSTAEVRRPSDLAMKAKPIYGQVRVRSNIFDKNQSVKLRVGNDARSSASISKGADNLKTSSTKKEPMKAVNPVRSMTQAGGGKLKIAPNGSGSKILSKLKKPGTSRREPDMEFMAQRGNPKPSYSASFVAGPQSSLRSSTKILKRSSSYSGKQLPVTINIIDNNKPSPFLRGFTGGDVKQAQNVRKPPVRSYSAEEKSGVEGLKHASYKKIPHKLKTEGGVGASVLKENSNRPPRKLNGIRKGGKENL